MKGTVAPRRSLIWSPCLAGMAPKPKKFLVVLSVTLLALARISACMKFFHDSMRLGSSSPSLRPNIVCKMSPIEGEWSALISKSYGFSFVATVSIIEPNWSCPCEQNRIPQCR